MSAQDTNKVVMITGAPGNIGRGVVKKFADTGAALVLIDRSKEACEALAEDMLSGHDCLSLGADIGKVEDMDAVAEAIKARYGRVDVVAHIAGGFGMGDPVHALNMDMFEKMMYLNARLTYVTCGRMARLMVETGTKGSIVAVLARAGLQGGKNMAAYTASKAAAERIVQSMALELREHDIRVNGIMPSTVDTPQNRKDMPNADFSKWVTPDQIADAITFLASDAASAISGASLPVYNKA